ncbi:MAG TPA: GDSL-type esterase/lipase family protein [Tepidisphaeraceae bacterium]|nr:GDSL-type esterase/lipase family protein [Tepidisphaeraceae bacterium]
MGRRFWLVVFVSVVTTGMAWAAGTISVMPLGDSITAGSNGGYRKPLAKKMDEVYHCPITAIGSQIDASLPPGEQAHEGHPGWRIDQLTDNLLGVNPVDSGAHGGYWLVGGHGTERQAVHPTFVTVMAGINDLNQMIGNDPNSPMSSRSDQILQTLEQRMRKLVGTLTNTLPDSTILLGGCIPYANGLLNDKLTGATEANRIEWAKQDHATQAQELGVNHWVLMFNRWIRDSYVPELQKKGKKVYYVDVYSKFILPDGTVRGWNNREPQNSAGPAGYGDYGLHPNAFGYAQMADAWAAAIAKQLGK